MKTAEEQADSVVDEIESLRRELATLAGRVASVENSLAAAGKPSEPQPAQRAERSPELPTAETIAVISAALAAYLGVKPHIRQITLRGGASWAQQGRVTIQASHALAIQRD